MKAFDVRTCSRCGDSYNARTITTAHRCACDRRCIECGRDAVRYVLDVTTREEVPLCADCTENGKASGTFRIATN